MRMMFSWLFTSWRNMISRKVRCASVAFWKASKIFLSATVSRVFLSTAFHTIPYAWRREVARQPGARRRIGRRAEREGQPGCPRVARAERRGAGGSRSAFCPPATASQLAVLSLLAWQRRKESHRGSQVSQRLAGAFGSSQGPRLAAGPRVPRARGTRAHTPPARRRGCAAARSVAGLRAACPSRSHAPACPCAWCVPRSAPLHCLHSSARRTARSSAAPPARLADATPSSHGGGGAPPRRGARVARRGAPRPAPLRSSAAARPARTPLPRRCAISYLRSTCLSISSLMAGACVPAQRGARATGWRQKKKKKIDSKKSVPSGGAVGSGLYLWWPRPPDRARDADPRDTPTRPPFPPYSTDEGSAPCLLPCTCTAQGGLSPAAW